MALILAIESATKVCSVALFNGNELIALKEETGDYSHAENLADFTAQVLKENNAEPKDLDAIAVSKGPGSYTGLRIGVSLAKGLCYSLNIPLIAVDTLKSLAYSITDEILENEFICPMIDARRMEVFTAVYNISLQEVETTSAKVIDESSFINFLNKEKVYFVGDGALKCKEIITHKNAIFVEQNLNSAAHLGELAHEKYLNKNFEDVAYFEPYYLKEFIALKGKKLV